MTLSSVDALRPVLAQAEAERDAALAAVRTAEQAAARSQAQADQPDFLGAFQRVDAGGDAVECLEQLDGHLSPFEALRADAGFAGAAAASTAGTASGLSA